MNEHEHADHPDFKFPVEVVYCGPKESEPCFANSKGERCPDEERNAWLLTQDHALIYTDGHVAVTLYECCYAMWYLRTGEVAGGSLWKTGMWKLSQAAVQKIIDARTP